MSLSFPILQLNLIQAMWLTTNLIQSNHNANDGDCNLLHSHTSVNTDYIGDHRQSPVLQTLHNITLQQPQPTLL